MKSRIAIIPIIILLVACHSNSKRYVHGLDECYYNDKNDKLVNDLYSFDINHLDSNNIHNNCYSGVRFDSSIVAKPENDTNLIYSLSDGVSEIKFIQLFFKYGMKKNLNLYGYSITSNIIKYKNGIRIGMSRDDFFKKLSRSSTDCDTFCIMSGLSGFYYYFFFNSDSLKRIDRIMVTM